MELASMSLSPLCLKECFPVGCTDIDDFIWINDRSSPHRLSCSSGFS